MADPKRVLLSDADLCKELGVVNRTTQRWRVAGIGPRFIRVGGRIRYARADVDAWLASQTFAHRAAEITGRSAAA